MDEDLGPDTKPPASLLLDRPGLSPEIRTDILNAAAIAFNERGYGGTSIDDVADQLGATKGRIYHYYRSKADIFLDLHLEALGILIDRVGRFAADPALPPARRLREMCRAHAFAVLTQIPYQKATMLGLNRFLLSISTPYQDAARQRINDLREEFEDLYVSTISEGMANGDFRPTDPRFSTKPLLGALNYAILWYEEGSDSLLGSVSDIADELADYCVSGLIRR